MPVLSAIAAIAYSLGFLVTSKQEEDLDLGTLGPLEDLRAFILWDLFEESLYFIFLASRAGDPELGDPERGDLEEGDPDRGDARGDPELLPVS